MNNYWGADGNLKLKNLRDYISERYKECENCNKCKKSEEKIINAVKTADDNEKTRSKKKNKVRKISSICQTCDNNINVLMKRESTKCYVFDGFFYPFVSLNVETKTHYIKIRGTDEVTISANAARGFLGKDIKISKVKEHIQPKLKHFQKIDEVTLCEYYDILKDFPWESKERKADMLDSKFLSFLGEETSGNDSTENRKNCVQIYSKNIIYYGPPGTGKTRKAKIQAAKIVEENENLSDREALEKANESSQIKLIQFHPGYSYNDFIETIDMMNLGAIKNGVFKDFVCKAASDTKKKYVLIIDEINRANVSEVLGELLYGIEYRGKAVTTSMSNALLSVPDNLYIIGTMNTADRSLQALDYAVRRRFAFEKVDAQVPDENNLNEENKYFYKDAFEQVKKDVEESVARGVDPQDIMPGISYFIVKKDENGKEDKEHFRYKANYELIPLLREYVKDGFFVKRRTIDGGKYLVEMLQDGTYCERLLKEKENGIG